MPLLTAAIVAHALSLSAAAAEPAPGPAFAGGGQLVIRVRPGIVAGFDAGRPTLREGEAGKPGSASSKLAGILERQGVRSIHAAMRHTPSNAELARALRLDRYYTVRLAERADADATAATLRSFGMFVESAEVDPVGGVAGEVPNDPFFGLQYALENTGQTIQGTPGLSGADISAIEAWTTTVGSELVIAVLDSGVNPHVDLGAKILPGWNVPQNNDVTVDVCNSHGTHVSGIAAAIGDNGIGIAGLAWPALILPVVVVDPCTGFESWVADAITYATDAGADVINMSLQYSAGTDYLHDAVLYAAAQGVVMAAASGNSASGVSYPAKWPETIAVGATNNLDQRWPSSNFGPELDVMAPGVNVYSLSGTTAYKYLTGTSMATPMVSGLAALLLSVDPTLTPQDVRTAIETTTLDLGTPGFDSLTGFGRINAAAALAAVLPPPVPGDLNGDGVVDGADLGLMLSLWGACADCELIQCEGDLNLDCVVDGADLGVLLSNWG
ncbi:MAG: S8 family serine peptidase [Phycisphaerales bacterium]|nr:S8 family serine peptidase [Phycisphaerales bacterium]